MCYGAFLAVFYYFLFMFHVKHIGDG